MVRWVTGTMCFSAFFEEVRVVDGWLVDGDGLWDTKREGVMTGEEERWGYEEGR